MLELQLVVLTIAENRLRILVGPRGLPSRAVIGGEKLDRAAHLLLREEVSADHLYVEQLYTFTLSGGRVVVDYLALVRNARVRSAESAWHAAQPLPRLVNGQKEVARYGLTRLRNKITYTNLAFAFLPARFTLSELQSTYEVVLERALDKRNFRKRILTMGILSADGVARHSSGGRPACLYRFTGPREVAFWPSFSPSRARQY
jgi:8-oxo-dGTP diphosphatase